MTTFTDRATSVAENLRYLGLGVITPGAHDDLAAADRRVEDAVAKVVNGLAGEPDYPTLAAALVDGSLTPAKAGAKLTGPTGARVQSLVAAVRAAAVAAEDRAEFSPASLRRSVVPIVRARLKCTADDMLSSIAGLPGVARDHLTQVIEGDTVHYGPLGSDQLADALKWLTPNGDLSTVRPDQLAAVQAAQAAWSWHASADNAFDPLYWLGTGQTGTTTYSGDRVGAGAAEAEQFNPALLLVGGDDVDYVAAGIPLTYAVAAGLVTEFAPIADPYNDDADAYAARVDRARQFVEWRDEARDTAVAGAGHLMAREQFRALQRREGLNKLDQVAAFRDHVGAKA